MPTAIAPIRGFHFHPPAKALVQFIPFQAQLLLRREPENQYDPNAIQVWIAPQAFPESVEDQLQVDLMGFGMDLAQFREQAHWLLGYIGKEFAFQLAGPLDNAKRVSATMAFDLVGKPCAQVVWEA